MSGKPLRVNAAIAKRVKRANYQVGRHGTCPICGKGWDDCPHDIAQAYDVIAAVKMAELLGIELP